VTRWFPPLKPCCELEKFDEVAAEVLGPAAAVVDEDAVALVLAGPLPLG